MKTICFVRHAKSSWDQHVSDSKRPLNERGLKDAMHIGKKLREKNIEFDAIYSSIAKRAQTTANIVVTEMGLSNKQIIVDESLYSFESNSIISFIHNLPNDQKNVLIFGHNPAFTSLVNVLGSIRFDNLPTSGVVNIQFDVDDWKLLNEGTTLFYLIPKLL